MIKISGKLDNLIFKEDVLFAVWKIEAANTTWELIESIPLDYLNDRMLVYNNFSKDVFDEEKSKELLGKDYLLYLESSQNKLLIRKIEYLVNIKWEIRNEGWGKKSFLY